MMAEARWYSVKSFYIWTPAGRAESKDEAYVKSTRMIEERVLLIRAKSFDAAIAKASKEADKYTSKIHQNPYGETISIKCTGDFEAFELYDDPDDLIEVFSTTEVSMTAKEAAAAIKSKRTKKHGSTERKLRKRFQQA